MQDISENDDANLKQAKRVFSELVWGTRPNGENEESIMPYLPFTKCLGDAIFGYRFYQMIYYMHHPPYGKESLIYGEKFGKIRERLISDSKFAKRILREMREDLELIEFEKSPNSHSIVRRYKLTRKGNVVFKNCTRWKMI